MLKIMMLPNKNQFFSIIDRSQGDVFLRLPDNSRTDLKKDSVARQMISLMEKRIPDGLQIDLTDQADAAPFIHYMAQAAQMSR